MCAAVCVAAAMLSSACGGSKSGVAGADSSGPVDGGRVRVGVVGLNTADLLSFDSANSGEVLAADLVYDGLTAFSPEEERVVPAIALKWMSADGVTWTFSLDPSRTFSDGTPVTATDVVASLSRVAKAAQISLTGARLSVIAGADAYVAGTADHISGLAAVDAHTVSITTATPYQELPALLADPGYGIAPAAPAATGSLGVGSGPFKIAASAPSRVTLDRSSPSLAHVDGIDLRIFATDDDAMAAFDHGELDVAPIPSAGKQVDHRHSVSAALVYLGMNVRSSVMSDVAVRSAVTKALDRAKIVSTVPNGRATVADGFVPEVVHSFGQCAKFCASDPKAASKAFATAFAAAKPTLALGFLASDDLNAMATEIQRELEAAGATVALRPQSAAELSASLAAGTDDLILFGSVGVAPTPDPYLADSFGTGGTENTSSFSSADVDAALATARATSNDHDRGIAYAVVERLVLEAAPAIPIASLHHDYATSKNLHGDDPTSGIIFDGRTVWLSKK